jgi:hypothetical protein
VNDDEIDNVKTVNDAIDLVIREQSRATANEA